MKAIPCPVSAEELRVMVESDKLTDREIAAMLGEGATIRRVQSWRLRYDIKATPRWSRNKVLLIRGKLKSLLVGSMLGDGRLVRHPQSTYYTESHCAKQTPYLEWKASIWGSWGQGIRDIPDKRGYPQVRFYTVSHASLNCWHDMFYPSTKGGWKRLVPSVVEQVDPLALAVWYLDDGHAGWWPEITFGMDTESHRVACLVFEHFGLSPRWVVQNGNTGVFRFEGETQATIFLNHIRPHVPACMSYKIDHFGFQGLHFQIRKRLPAEKLSQLAAASVPIAQIARSLGVGASTVSRHLKKLDIAHPRKVGQPSTTYQGDSRELLAPRRKKGVEHVSQFMKLAEEGLTLVEIGSLCGVSADTVRRRLIEGGMNRRKPGPKGRLGVEAATELLQAQYSETTRWKNLSKSDQQSWVGGILGILQRCRFPYPELEGAEKEWDSLCSYEPRLALSFRGLRLCYPFFPNRYKARYNRKISAFEGWHDARELERAIRWQLRVGDPVTPKRVLKAITANCRTPSVFRPTVARYLCSVYCPKGGIVWDPCAGYGGRVLGVLSCDTQYIGTDVEIDTIEGNKRLVEHLGLSNRASFRCVPAEDFDPGPVDLVFTSPPYFDRERYSKGSSQSWVQYDNLEAWVSGFMLPVFRTAWRNLKPGSRLVWNIADIKERRKTVPLVQSSIDSALSVGFEHETTLEMPLARLNRKDAFEPMLVFRRL